VALLSWGEGWHNNHHAHPTSARHGLTWYEVDLNWYGIWTLKKLGLARDIYLTKLPPKKSADEASAAEIVPAEAQSDLVSA
jgi:stearoyl-CoA desaturase (delta-9 desaturase)